MEEAVLQVRAEGLRLTSSLPAFAGAVAQIDCGEAGLSLRLRTPSAATRKRLLSCRAALEERLARSLSVPLRCEVSR